MDTANLPLFVGYGPDNAVAQYIGWSVCFEFGPLAGRVVPLTEGLAELGAILKPVLDETSTASLVESHQAAMPIVISGPDRSVSVDLAPFGHWAGGLLAVIAGGVSTKGPTRFRVGLSLPANLAGGVAGLAGKVAAALFDLCDEATGENDDDSDTCGETPGLSLIHI